MNCMMSIPPYNYTPCNRTWTCLIADHKPANDGRKQLNKCSVCSWKGSSLGEHWKAEHPGSDFVFQIFSQSLRLSRLTRKTDKKAKKFCNTSNLQ